MPDSNPDASHGEENCEIEQPRLEDSRGGGCATGHPALLLLPHELSAVLPRCGEARHARDPLLSSTMVHDLLDQDQDWLTASSIRVSNSRDSIGLSDRLNNADICLETSASASASASALPGAAAEAAVSPSTSACAVVGPESPARQSSPSASNAAVDASAVSTSASSDIAEAVATGDAADATSEASLASLSASGSGGTSSFATSGSVSSPRLRVPASDAADAAQQEPPLPQQQQPHTLGLLQVCRLTLDVLSEGGLLCQDVSSWLTPELLCDKLCDRLYCQQHHPPRPPPPPEAARSADSSIDAAGVAAAAAAAVLEFESPIGRVRRWLLTEGGGPGSAQLPRHVTNSV